jgi:hypothetical protein
MAKKIVVGQIKQWEEPIGVMNAKFVAANSEVRTSLNWEDATLVIHEGKPERVYTHSDVEELIKCGNAMSTAMYSYQMDVDDSPPQKHRDMMMRWEQAVIRFLDPTE